MRTFLASVPLFFLITACCFGGGSFDIPVDDPALGGGGATTEEAPIPPGPGGTAGGSCDMRAALGSCTEYVAGGPAISLLGADLAASVCQAGSGTWTTGPCPADGRLGVCNSPAGSPAEGTTAHYYAMGERAFTAESARAACETSEPPGTFVPSAP